MLIADIDVETAATVCWGRTRNRDSGSTTTYGRWSRPQVKRWGRLDILVNNAFEVLSAGSGDAVEVPEEVWDHGMAVLVKSIYLGAKYAVPEMEKAGGGSIVNVSSVHGILMAPGTLVYEAGKAAAIGVTRQLATEYGPLGIRVNAVLPGHMVTERLQASLWDDNPSGLRFFEDQYPLRKVGARRRHRQRDRLPMLGRGILHHGPSAGRGRRPHDPAAGELRGTPGALHPGQPGHAAAVLSPNPPREGVGLAS